jgi:Single-stranded DNA-binding protein
MNTSNNYIQISGRLTADVSPNEKKTFARFCLVHNFIGDADPIFLNCVIYKREFDENRQMIPWNILQKGTEIFITGKLAPNNWTDKDGVKHRGFDVVVSKIREFDD